MKRFFKISAFLSLLVLFCVLACKGAQDALPTKVKVEVIAEEGGVVKIKPDLPKDGIVQEVATFEVTAEARDSAL